MNKEKLQNNQECLRSTIHRIVSAIVPFDHLEEEHIDFVKKWISSGAEIFRLAKPDQPNIHLVSYFIVADQQTHQFLLVDHKKAQLWLPPGGHVEVDEHPQETVKREIREELGIEAAFLFEDPLFLTVTNTVGHVACHTDVSLWYVLKGNSQDDLKYDPDEFHQVRWFKRQEIPFTQTDPHMKRFVDKVINKLVTLSSYDASAVQYAKNTDPLHPKEDAQKFLDLLPKSATVVDIGCGPGRDAKIFSDHGFHVVGVDFSSKMIETARKNAPDSIFYVMDIESLAFPSNTFEGAWANCALLHIPKKNIPLVLSKVYAILKPKGVLYVSVKQHHVDELLAPDARYEGLEKYWSFYGQDELMNLLSHAGFKIIEAEISGKKSDYQTHPIIKIYAQKPSYY